MLYIRLVGTNLASLMDITFNVENKLYRLISTSNEMKIELAANLWFLSVGVILLIYL